MKINYVTPKKTLLYSSITPTLLSRPILPHKHSSPPSKYPLYLVEGPVRPPQSGGSV